MLASFLFNLLYSIFSYQGEPKWLCNLFCSEFIKSSSMDLHLHAWNARHFVFYPPLDGKILALMEEDEDRGKCGSGIPRTDTRAIRRSPSYDGGHSRHKCRPWFIKKFRPPLIKQFKLSLFSLSYRVDFINRDVFRANKYPILSYKSSPSRECSNFEPSPGFQF